MKKIRLVMPYLLFAIGLLTIILLIYKDYGVSWDEKVYLNVGKFYLVKIFSFFHIPTNLDSGSFVPTTYHTLGHGAFFETLVVALSLFFKKFSFETYHLIKGLLAIPIFLLTGYIVAKLTDKKMGILAMTFLLFIPSFFGQILINSIDVPTALFSGLLISYFIYLMGTPATIFKYFVLGLISALAINQRLVLSYLVILNIFFLFSKKGLVFLFAFCLSTLVFLHLTHPYLLAHPIIGLIELTKLTQGYPWNAAVLFEGRLINANSLPFYYLLKSMIITIPISIIGLFTLGFYYLINQVRKNKILYSYLVLVFITPFVLNYFLKPVIYDSWRHFMFLAIPMVVIACFGLKLILNHKSLILKSILIFLIILDLSLVGYGMLTLHPYEYIYYNSFVGGLRGAYGKYETDYLGLSYKEATEWFNKNINDEKSLYKIKAEGDPLSSTYYFKKNMIFTNETSRADYIFSFTRWNLDKLYTGKIVHIVEREGIPLVFIKKNEK